MERRLQRHGKSVTHLKAILMRTCASMEETISSIFILIQLSETHGAGKG